MIFVLIAGSCTPFGLLVLHGTLGTTFLIAAWSAGLAGSAFKLVWIDAAGWLSAAVYIAVGWIAIVVLPELVDRLGIVAVGTLGPGGVRCSTGAVIHARTRPDPAPTVSATTSRSICW
jgi:hemolysin III